MKADERLLLGRLLVRAHASAAFGSIYIPLVVEQALLGAAGGRLLLLNRLNLGSVALHLASTRKTAVNLAHGRKTMERMTKAADQVRVARRPS